MASVSGCAASSGRVCSRCSSRALQTVTKLKWGAAIRRMIVDPRRRSTRRRGAALRADSADGALEEIGGISVQLEVEAVAALDRLDGLPAQLRPRRAIGSHVLGDIGASAPAEYAREEGERLVEPLGEAHRGEPREVRLRALEREARYPAARQVHFAGHAPRLAVVHLDQAARAYP